jgi:hypothetical protein
MCSRCYGDGELGEAGEVGALRGDVARRSTAGGNARWLRPRSAQCRAQCAGTRRVPRRERPGRRVGGAVALVGDARFRRNPRGVSKVRSLPDPNSAFLIFRVFLCSFSRALRDFDGGEVRSEHSCRFVEMRGVNRSSIPPRVSGPLCYFTARARAVVFLSVRLPKFSRAPDALRSVLVPITRYADEDSARTSRLVRIP